MITFSHISQNYILPIVMCDNLNVKQATSQQVFKSDHLLHGHTHSLKQHPVYQLYLHNQS